MSIGPNRFLHLLCGSCEDRPPELKRCLCLPATSIISRMTHLWPAPTKTQVTAADHVCRDAPAVARDRVPSLVLRSRAPQKPASSATTGRYIRRQSLG